MSGEINKIITGLSQDKELMEVCKKIVHNSPLWKDLFQQTMMFLFERPQEVILQSYRAGKIKGFAIKYMMNQQSDPYSAFHKQGNIKYTSDISSLVMPSFSEPTTSANIPYWQNIIKENNYYITEITPHTIKAVQIMEEMKEYDRQHINAKDGKSGFPYRTIIFNEYLRFKSIRKVEQHFNGAISFMDIHRTITSVKKKLRGND